jgi:polysaccharide biosynthesis protein PelG
MAGIGFRLKRLTADDSATGWLRAHVYAAVVTSGPWLLSICTLAALAVLGGGVVGASDQDLFRSMVVYTYTFSLITTGGVQMVITRHVADELYGRYLAALRPLFRWTIGATALGHALLAALFYGLAPDLAPAIRLLGVVLYVVVGCTWIAMIFLGTAHDYRSVAVGFLAGSTVSVGLALLLGGHGGLAGYLGGFVLGQITTFFVLSARIDREVPTRSTPQGWRLLRSFRRYAILAVAGVVYHCAIAADRLVFWASDAGWRVGSWFYGSVYDAPLFLAYLSILPSLAVFLVSVETDFYDRYREYYGVVTKHGTLRQVLEAKSAMAGSLRESVRRLLVVQAPVTLALMALAPWIVAAMRMERMQISILRLALVGAAIHVLTLFGSIVLLYFDRRRAVVEVCLVFLASNVLFTLASLGDGPRFYGFGYPIAAMVACAWAYRRIEETLADLEYLTFAAQPMAPPRRPAVAGR